MHANGNVFKMGEDQFVKEGRNKKERRRKKKKDIKERKKERENENKGREKRKLAFRRSELFV